MVASQIEVKNLQQGYVILNKSHRAALAALKANFDNTNEAIKRAAAEKAVTLATEAALFAKQSVASSVLKAADAAAIAAKTASAVIAAAAKKAEVEAAEASVSASLQIDAAVKAAAIAVAAVTAATAAAEAASVATIAEELHAAEVSAKRL